MDGSGVVLLEERASVFFFMENNEPFVVAHVLFVDGGVLPSNLIWHLFFHPFYLSCKMSVLYIYLFIYVHAYP